MPFLLIANPGARSSDDLARRAEDRLDDVRRVELREGLDLRGEIERAVSESRTIVACGGDGTVHALAQHLAGGDGVLGVLPGGTLNHFARDLGVRRPEIALETLRNGTVRAVDVGRAGEHVFVNNFTLGVYPELVQQRERTEHRWGRWMAASVAAVSVLRGLEPLVGTIAADDDARQLEAVLVFVGNNRYSTKARSVGRRERLDEGVLDVRVIRARSGMRARAGIALRLLRVRRPSRVVGTTAETVDIELVLGSHPIALDGEPDERTATSHVHIEPRALRVLAPAPDRLALP